jgi:hypothetical protein
MNSPTIRLASPDDAVTLQCVVAFSGKSTAPRRAAEKQGATLILLDAIYEQRGLHGGEGHT